jgi:hypothetical protein
MHKITKHSCIVNRLRRYRKQTGNINPHPWQRSLITYSILAWRSTCFYIVTLMHWNIVFIESCMYKSVFGKINKLQKKKVFIWRHVVYVPKSSTTFRGILICVICRPSDMQEYYMLSGIFEKDVGLYFLSVFYITWADF